MEYNVNINGEEFELPSYTVGIMEKIDKVETKSNSQSSIKDKLKCMYEFLGDILGKETRSRAIGDFNVADPNIINIAYLNILKEYNKPLSEYQEREVNNTFESAGLEKVADAMEVLNKLDTFSRVK